MLSNPQKELGAPPESNAKSGRMNATGISVFYGGLSELTAVSEIRPSVGCCVVVGSFYAKRPLRVLDLRQLGHNQFVSLFDPEYPIKVGRNLFLEQFHRLVTQPVQPEDSALEYIPTQCVADYVANDLRFDGILYRSAQVGDFAWESAAEPPMSSSPSASLIACYEQEAADPQVTQRDTGTSAPSIDSGLFPKEYCNVVLFGSAIDTIVLRENPRSPRRQGSEYIPSTAPTSSGTIVENPRVVEVRGIRYAYEDRHDYGLSGIARDLDF